MHKLLTVGFFSILAWGEDAGRVRYLRSAKPDLDPYTNSPTPAEQRWFRSHFTRMVVYSPYFDSKTSWYPNGLVYKDLYGIPRESPVVREHPNWVLHDTHGNLVYIPWGCAQGVCPQYAADIGNREFRAWWINQARSTLSHGYLGLCVDDVNLEFRVSDGTGQHVAPIDSSTGHAMTEEAWRNHVADFVEQIRAAFPNIEIAHNAIWFAGPNGARDQDSAIQRQIKAADNFILERGVASDMGLTGGTGEWSVHALFAFIDRVHALGRSVTLQEYDPAGPMREYALAAYLLVSTGKDFLGDMSTNPTNWWDGYDVDLGEPTGPRTYSDGVYQRKFSCGLVLLGEPGLRTQTMPLTGSLTTLDGRAVHSVELSSRKGIVLRSCQNPRSAAR